MQWADRSREILVLLLSVVGTAALFLPFAGNASPWKALGGWFALPFLAAPAFLAVPILAWQLRRLLTSQLSVLELTAAYLLSLAAMLSVVLFTGSIVLAVTLDPSSGKQSTFVWIVYGLPWILALANFLLLYRNLRKAIGREATAEAFLVGGYLPNAMFCLFIFGLDGKLQVGAYLVALVCIGYAVAIVLLSRQRPADVRLVA